MVLVSCAFEYVFQDTCDLVLEAALSICLYGTGRGL